MNPLVIVAHLAEMAAALLVLGVSAGVGRALLRRLGADGGDELERLLFSTALGAGVIGTVYLIQGLVAIHPLAVWATLVILGLLARRDCRAVGELVAELVRLGHRRLRSEPLAAGTTTVLLAAGLFLLIQSLAPPTDWDSLMYHLEIPRAFLAEGRILLPADNLHVTRVGLIHLLYLPLLVVGDSGPAVLNALFAVLLALAVLACGRRFLSRGAGLLGSVLLWGTSTILLVAITPRVDATLALYGFLAQYALLLALTDEEPGPAYLMAAVLLGFGVGIKLHGLAIGAAASPLILWVAWQRWGGTHRLRALGVFTGVAAVVGLPWLIKNMMLVGAPLYPLMADPVVQPWLAELLGSRTFPPSVDPAVLDFIWQLRDPFNLRDAFLAPGSLSIESEGAWYYTAPVLALLPMILLYLGRSRILWLAVPAVLYGAILVLLFPRSNLRYLLPAVPALTLVTGDAVLRTLRRLRKPMVTRSLVGLVVAVTLVPPGLTAARWLSGTRAVDHILGGATDLQYLSSHHDPSVSTFAPVLRFANDSLPSGARVLMLMDARGFHFRVPVLQDNKGTNWALLKASPAAARCLEGSGISHVLLGKGPLTYYIRGGLDPETLGFAGAFRSFADRCLEPVYEDRAFVVFRVTPPAT